MHTKPRPSLTCCDAARITRAVTLEAEGQGQPDFAERCRIAPPAWRLRLDLSQRSLVDLSPEDTLAFFAACWTPVRHCPFCGATPPALRLVANPPAKICISTDGGYSCDTCGEDRDCECAPPESLWEPVS